MPVLLLAAVALAAVFLILALYGGKGGPRETAPVPVESPGGEGRSWLSRLSLDGLEKLLQRLFGAMRFTVEQSEVRAGRLDMQVVDPTPITGGRVHVRALVHADHGMVEQAEVQATLDEARWEGSAKAVVVSPLGFSAEARLAVRSTPCELVDEDGLLDLLERYLPEAVESEGAGYL